MISHADVKTFKCSYCIMSFGYKYHLDRHVKVVHLSERMECPTCNLQFKKKKAFHRHIEKDHKVKSIKKMKKGVSVDESKINDHTNTKIGNDDSHKN